MKLAVTIIICSIIGFYFYNKQGAHNNYDKTEVYRNTANASQASVRASSSSNARNISEHANIDKTLKIVAEKWKKTDVNGDGLYNCIDAAVLFYQYYPDKSKVCIEVNKNPATGMNHAFNCVFTDGVWKAIEPQAYAINHSNYLMWAVWGNEYDNKYNYDATEEYKRYVIK
jgi:hypothetical protein